MQRSTLAILAAAVVFVPMVASMNQAIAGEVRNREVHEQQRIDQGVKNGTIQPSELRNLEGRIDKINQTRVSDLQKNGGHLTPQERRNLNRRENHLSHAIYRDKHNDGVQPQTK